MRIPSQLRMASVQKRHEHVLGDGPSALQPLFALELLPTENHTRTMAVPIDGGRLGIVLVQEQFCALRVARDGVEGSAGWVDHDGIGDLCAATRKFELDRGSLVIPAGRLDQRCFRRHRKMSPARSTRKYLSGVED
jgi:hypothetical protein